jgi:hypothetical protein
MFHKKPLHIPHGSRNIADDQWSEFPRPIPELWEIIAEEKGYRIDRRVRDHLHVVLECLACGAHTAHRVSNLRSAQPACGGCQLAARLDDAAKAGFVFKRRDEAHRHYAIYTLPCGHDARLQQGRVAKLANEGRAPKGRGYHCDICYAKKLDRLASTLGWTLIGADTEGNPNYRLLWHDACGHSQRVATANLETGRFNCGGCGECWSAAPSALYMVRFWVPGLGWFVKLGYSRYPGRRMRYQLGLREDVEAELIDEVPVPSGQVALRMERALHRQLKAEHPDKVIPRDELAAWINVTSEVYTAEAEPIIRRMLDEVESRHWPRKDKTESSCED